eukprot:TRINITY_DN31774_c0_g1_i1.p1 TRINITY_DN31774_c0_g1~~TRINITY_DN31774_c0_g1_i1.p1  ORF type:complete len:360 (+),score=42.97 TRINITY_DN31774_c0_g1_i1:88-1167(+)
MLSALPRRKVAIAGAVSSLFLAVTSHYARSGYPLPHEVLREHFPDLPEGRELAGQTALVTGANAGVGFETARALVNAGANVILACRSTDRCAKALSQIKLQRPGGQVSSLQINLENMTSVKEMAAKFLEKHSSLHLLFLNAGVTGIGWQEVVYGHTTRLERRFATNHLGHFYLAHKLLSALRHGTVESGRSSRIIVVASRSHRMSPPLPDLPWHNANDLLGPTISIKSTLVRDAQLYGLSKLCNVLFAKEIPRRWGPEILGISLHPGSSMLTNGGESGWLSQLWLRIVHPWSKSVEQGASTSIFAAVSRDLRGGEYLDDCNISQTRHKDATSREKARELWGFSTRLLWNLTKDRDVFSS